MRARDPRPRAIASLAAGAAQAQDRVLQVVSTDSEPVSYAFVQANGGHALLTDEEGRVNMGPGKKQTFTLDVRRIGFTPFYGKIDFPDTAITIRVVLTKLAQQLSSDEGHVEEIRDVARAERLLQAVARCPERVSRAPCSSGPRRSRSGTPRARASS